MAQKVILPAVFWVLLVACWRVLLAVCVRTSFDPDEYWQGPEVAHRLVFGYDSSGAVVACASLQPVIAHVPGQPFPGQGREPQPQLCAGTVI